MTARPRLRVAQRPHTLRVLMEACEPRVLMASGNWSNPATWANGQVPVAGQVVTIPAGDVVTLDTNTAALGGLIINGTLQASDTKNLSLTSRYVGVDGGTLRVGTETNPFDYKFTLTLTGNDTGANITVGHHAFGDKFLGVAGGTIDLHGVSRSKTAWTRLAASVAAGANKITLATNPGWKVGDVIAIAPSGLDTRQTERRTITAVANVGKTLTLNAPLSHAHYGSIDTYSGKQIDMRAEVGLLTRNIVIQGDAASYDAGYSDTSAYLAGFGGHFMIHHESTVRVQGAEFYRMGQSGQLGRYPIHWHFAGDATGSYVKNNAIHDSLQRGIVIHQTANTTVENNVVYRALNHLYIVGEDGAATETGNVFRYNLGLHNVQPLQADAIFPFQPGLNQDEDRSSGVWSRNTGNTFIGNAMAGIAHGQGYHFTKSSLTDLPIVFDGNVAHSITEQSTIGNNPSYSPTTSGHGLLVDLQPTQTTNVDPMSFTNFTAYKTTNSGAWLNHDEHVLDNARIADTPNGVTLQDGGTVKNTLINGDSNNNIGPAPEVTVDVGITAGIVGIRHTTAHHDAFISDTAIMNVAGGVVASNRFAYDTGANSVRMSLTNVPKPFVNYSPLAFQTGTPGPIMERSFQDSDGSLSGYGVATTYHGLPNAPQANWRYSRDTHTWVVRSDGGAIANSLNPADYIAFDDFELGSPAGASVPNWTSGGFGWSTNGSSNWTAAPAGTKSVRDIVGVNGGETVTKLSSGTASITRPRNLSSVASAYVSFYYTSNSMVSADKLYLDVYNGSSWTTIKTINGPINDGVWRSTTAQIPAGALNANFQLRIRAGGAPAFIDDVAIIAGAAPASLMAMGTSSPAATPVATDPEPQQSSLGVGLFSDTELSDPLLWV